MSNYEHKTAWGKRVSKRADVRFRALEISISGLWALENDALMEKVDGALHEAGLCACSSERQFYSMSVREIPEAAPAQPDNRA